jgi:hypothetical protein
MPNMSYCRFVNTYQDLQECFEHMDDEDLSEGRRNIDHVWSLFVVKLQSVVKI